MKLEFHCGENVSTCDEEKIFICKRRVENSTVCNEEQTCYHRFTVGSKCVYVVLVQYFLKDLVCLVGSNCGVIFVIFEMYT